MTRLTALGLWLLVAACAAFWGLKLFVKPAPVPPQAGTVASGPVLRGDLTRLLGAAPEVPEEPTVAAAASRFRLIGVVAPRAARSASEGLALIAVDGKPAKAYRVGASIDGDLVLQRVRARGADLGARGAPTAAVALDVAGLPPAATGRPAGLPVAQAGAGPGYVRPPPNLAVRPGQPRVSADGNEVVNGEGDDGLSDEPPQPAPMRQGLQTQ